MIMEIVLNPRYQHLHRYVEQIPKTFERIEHIIQNDRNDVRMDTVDDHKLVVKSFKGMYFTNKLAYSLFRKSKAMRSYETSLHLAEKGILVPDPIASIDCYQNGFLTTSYFISTYYEHTSFNEMLSRAANKDQLLSSFVNFTYKLHQAGIYHKDYSNGNILCNDSNGELTFCLVDLNRVLFGPVAFEHVVSNFSTLAVTRDDLGTMIKCYAELSGKPPADIMDTILTQQRKRAQFARLKKNAKAVFFPGRLRKEAAAVRMKTFSVADERCMNLHQHE
jgi:tRNA A-37 threonylcarbamoyl transferase component Bud32